MQVLIILHSGYAFAIGCKGVIALIKTINLYTAAFWLLIIAAVAAAVLFLLSSDSSDYISMLTSNKSDVPVLVIDAGHGGEDGGAVSLSGTEESEINLDISQRMAALSELTGIEFRMTRDNENIEYPRELKSTSKRKKYDQKRRVEFINGISNAVLLSVHQNCYPQESPYGPQSFYSKNERSVTLSAIIQDSMNQVLCPGNRRLSVPVSSDIYLFENVKCPAVLVECGFVSNPEESKLLDTETYRLKIAAVLISAYLKYLDTNE